MKVVIDMNLAPAWVEVFTQHGIECVHWSSVGSPSAPDSEIVKWAVEHGHVVFTHDLDFGAILAASHAVAPSVIQVRTQDVQSFDFIEVAVLAHDPHRVLHRKRGDPDVVFRDRASFAFETKPDRAVVSSSAVVQWDDFEVRHCIVEPPEILARS